MVANSRKRYKRLAKEGGWIVLGQVASVSGTLALVRVLTEMLDPAEYGRLALGLSVGGGITQVLIGGIGNAITRYYSIAAEEGDLHGYLKSAGRLMLYATFIAILLGLVLIIGLVLIDQSQWFELVALIFVLTIMGGFNSVLSGIQNAARQRAIVALHGGLDTWLKIGLAVGVMHWLGHTSTAVIMGYSLSAVFIILSQLFFLWRLLCKRSSVIPNTSTKDWLKLMWTYGWPFSAWGLFTWAQQISDRWALETFSTTDIVGQYIAVFQLGYAPIGIANGLLVSLLEPILFQRAGDASDHCRNNRVRQITWRITGITLTCTGLVFILTLLTHEWIFNLLVAAPFRKASFYWPWVLMAGGLFAAGQTLALQLLAEMQSAKMAIAKTVTAILGITLNILGAKEGGMEGVVMALVAFSAVYFLWMCLLSARR